MPWIEAGSLPMLRHLSAAVLTLALCATGELCAQTKGRTETIRPPAGPQAPEAKPATPVAPGPQTPPAQAAPPQAASPQAPPAGKPTGHVLPPGLRAAAPPEIITDRKRLPAPVGRMGNRILEAARSGDLDKVLTAMQTNETMPVFSFGNEKDPVAYWKANYPDSGGIELLAILVEILEAGFVHVDKGTPQEMYVWPYFAHVSLKDLTLEQKVELFKIVTGSDYREMEEFGAYNFYRLGIAPDGTWHFFVTGD